MCLLHLPCSSLGRRRAGVSSPFNTVVGKRSCIKYTKFPRSQNTNRPNFPTHSLFPESCFLTSSLRTVAMPKRPYPGVSDFPNSPHKYRKLLNIPPGVDVPLNNNQQRQAVIQNPTPDRSADRKATSLSPRAGTSSTTASKPYTEYETPEKHLKAEYVRTLGTGGQARAVLVHTNGCKGSTLQVAKYFKKEKYCIRESRILKKIHMSGSKRQAPLIS
jgi:hypothetical protein